MNILTFPCMCMRLLVWLMPEKILDWGECTSLRLLNIAKLPSQIGCISLFPYSAMHVISTSPNSCQDLAWPLFLTRIEIIITGFIIFAYLKIFLNLDTDYWLYQMYFLSVVYLLPLYVIYFVSQKFNFQCCPKSCPCDFCFLCLEWKNLSYLVLRR